MISKRPSFKKYKKEALKDPVFRTEYDALHQEFELIKQSIKIRQKTFRLRDKKNKNSGNFI